MISSITKPVMEDLSEWKRGRVKFIDPEKNFGFILTSSDELFVHRNWLCEPHIEIIDSIYALVLEQTDIIFDPDQKVLFREVNAPRGSEAHDVVDELSVQLLRRELRKSYNLAISLWQTLSSYRVTMIKDILVPKADNTSKGFTWDKVGETRVVLFEGNNISAMRHQLSEPPVTGVLSQPHTRLEYQTLIDGKWVECGDPR